ncbi:MAG TPA: amino acid permease, partial [Ktedonobacteraceae bacterium]|nr:amino acid permease [Ktedonobacteraceae bacterium]
MALETRNPARIVEKEVCLTNEAKAGSSLLPPLMRKRDLIFFIILVIVGVPYMPAMQFAGAAAFVYWGLGFLTFLLPCIFVTGWLTRKAPSRVSMYLWMTRLVDMRWRSFLLFLIWWIGVLGVISILGQCLSSVRQLFPAQFNEFWPKCVFFMALLVIATLLASLPLRVFTRIVGLCTLLYLTFFALLGCAAFVWLIEGHAPASAQFRSPMTGLPGGLIWPIFGLTIFSLLGLNIPLFMDGEMSGAHP